MVNPGISRDGKYPQITKIGKYKIKYTKFCCYFFLKNILKFSRLYYVTVHFKDCYTMQYIGTL